MRTFTDAELKAKGFAVLVQALGDVNAERFIFLNNCETGDYTRWRQNNLFAGESLDEVLDRAEQADLRRAERLKSAPVI